MPPVSVQEAHQGDQRGASREQGVLEFGAGRGRGRVCGGGVAGHVPLRKGRSNEAASRPAGKSRNSGGAFSASVRKNRLLEVSLAKRQVVACDSSRCSVAPGVGVLRDFCCDGPWFAGCRAEPLCCTYTGRRYLRCITGEARSEASSSHGRLREIRDCGRRKGNAAG